MTRRTGTHSTATSILASLSLALIFSCAAPLAFPQSQPDDAGKKSHKENHKPISSAKVHNAILWQDPGDISTKNLVYGQGGEHGQPKPPFTFLD